MPSAPPTNTPPHTPPVLSPLLYVAPQMPMLPCNSCLTMCPTKCCHPMEGRGSEEEGGFGWGGRKGGCWIWMGGTGSWILIIFSFFFLPENELSLSTWSSCLLLCLDYQYIITMFYFIYAHSVFLFLSSSISLTLWVFLSLIWFWIRSRWWPAPMFPPLGHRKPLEAERRRRERQSEGAVLLVQQVNDTRGDQ